MKGPIGQDQTTPSPGYMNFHTQIIAMYPLYGPAAGGTVITIQGQDFYRYTPLQVRLGPIQIPAKHM